jgi:CubicO group peptidase (beta-lactamase class C family)
MPPGALFLLFFVSTALGAQEPVKHPKQVAKIDSIVRKAMTDGPIPGLSLAVVRRKETIVARGYGVANLADSTPATAETVYPIASITKQFTAAAILQQVEEDKIELKDELSRYLPDFPSQGKKVTIKQLLNHTSGIPNDFHPDSSSPPRSALEFTPAEFLTTFGPLPREFPPGEQFSYSNSGYYLLGLVLEKVSGEKYGDYLKRHVFPAAQMTASADCSEPGIRHATGYDRPDSTWIPAPPIEGDRLYAAAGICSTVLDLVKWQRALEDHKVVNAFYWGLMKEPTELKDGSRASYGFGLALGRLDKHRSLGHGGSVPGFSSQITFYPDDDLTVVVLANSERALTRRIADQVAIVMLGVIEPKVKDLPLAAADLDKYTGVFDLSGRALEVYVSGGRLMMKIDQTDGIRLLYQGTNEFVAEPDPATKVYFRLSQGRAKSLVFSAGDLNMTADRKSSTDH